MANSNGNIKHGMHGTLTYSRWRSMMSRCYQVNASNYKYYGLKGIKVCQSWHEFYSFFLDMGECPDETMTLDRINNEGDYEKNNCRWATQAKQNSNRSSCVILTYNGVSKNVAEWAKDIGISANSINQRRYLGWSVEKILTTPLKRRTNK
ncbi:MAG: hypothetical protein Q8S71_03935 [Hydrogenophaga sp.]|nr:hypothetical protein [Hydrogenophaga sp.]